MQMPVSTDMIKKGWPTASASNLLLPAVLGLVLVGETRVERGGLQGERLLLGGVRHFGGDGFDEQREGAMWWRRTTTMTMIAPPALRWRRRRRLLSAPKAANLTSTSRLTHPDPRPEPEAAPRSGSTRNPPHARETDKFTRLRETRDLLEPPTLQELRTL